jgi:hypothetical protein
MSWRNSNFEPGQVTEVEDQFEPADDGIQVTVAHRGWDALPKGTRRVMGWRAARPRA